MDCLFSISVVEEDWSISRCVCVCEQFDLTKRRFATHGLASGDGFSLYLSLYSRCCWSREEEEVRAGSRIRRVVGARNRSTFLLPAEKSVLDPKVQSIVPCPAHYAAHRSRPWILTSRYLPTGLESSLLATLAM